MSNPLAAAFDQIIPARRRAASATIPTPHTPGIGVLTMADRSPVTIAVFELWARRAIVTVAAGLGAIAVALFLGLWLTR